ncbi:hypothetical protein Tco_0865854 [Tanacetum coccineum]
MKCAVAYLVFYCLLAATEINSKVLRAFHVQAFRLLAESESRAFYGSNVHQGFWNLTILTWIRMCSRPDSLQNLCGSSRRPKQSQNIIGILRAHDGCATSSATSDLPAYNDLGDWKNSFRDHGQQNQPIYRNHFKATLTDGTADGQFFMPAVDEVIGCTCSELAQRYKQVHPHQTLSLSAEVNRTPVIHYHIHLGDVPKVPVLYKMTTEGNDDPSAGNSSGKPTCTFVIGALSYGPRKRIRNPALIENDIHASKSTLSKRQHVYTSTHVDCTGTLSYRPRKRTRNLAFIRNENGANGSTSSKRPHVCIDDGSQNPSPVMYTPTVAGSSSGTPGHTSPTHVDYTDHAFCLLIRRLRQKEVKIRALENYEKEKRRDRGERCSQSPLCDVTGVWRYVITNDGYIHIHESKGAHLPQAVACDGFWSRSLLQWFSHQFISLHPHTHDIRGTP